MEDFLGRRFDFGGRDLRVLVYWRGISFQNTGSTGSGQTIPFDQNQVLVGVGGQGMPVVSVSTYPALSASITFQLANPNLAPGPNQALTLWVCTAGRGTSNPQYATADAQGALIAGVQ
jgi:hypothetical protein